MPEPPVSTSIQPAEPRRQLTLFDSTSIIVGIIIGSAIYKSSPDIATGAARFGDWLATRWQLSAAAQGTLETATLIGVWLIGGLIALVGAMCYAELATADPRPGGTYAFLSAAFGRSLGFAFVWAEFWIVRPGNVGAIAFVLARYARQLLPASGLADHTAELTLALGAIVLITLLNALGLRSGKWTQNLLTAAKVIGLAAIVIAACTLPAGTTPRELPTEPWKTLSLSLILVMFAYGGWADMSYVAAEVRDPERNISRALILGILAVGGIYLAVTLAFLWALGMSGLAASDAVAAEVMQLRIGPAGATFISLLVIVSCLGSINGTIFTGARVYYALGSGHPGFRWLGAWDEGKGIPLRSLLVQSVATLGLVLAFGFYPEGFDRLVVFTTPFFWGFIALVGVAHIIARRRGAAGKITYRAPLFPLTPMLFIFSSCAMVVASLDYARRNPAWESLWAVAVIGAGIVVGIVDWRMRRASDPAQAR